MRKIILILLFLLLHRGTLCAQSSTDTLKPFTIRATYYSDIFVGRRTSSGEIFKQSAFTAAHRDLPLGTLLLVTNMETGCQVIVRVNDRCPRSGVLDLTKRAARILGIGSKIVEAKVLPQQYAQLWERQGEVEGSQRKLRLTAIHADADSNILANADSAQKQLTYIKATTKGKKGNTTHNKSTTETTKDIVEDEEVVLYSLDLATAPSRREAEDMITRRLPMKYQNECVVIPDGRTSRHRIILDAQLPEKEARKTQKELTVFFPACELRKITKND